MRNERASEAISSGKDETVIKRYNYYGTGALHLRAGGSSTGASSVQVLCKSVAQQEHNVNSTCLSRQSTSISRPSMDRQCIDCSQCLLDVLDIVIQDLNFYCSPAWSIG